MNTQFKSKSKGQGKLMESIYERVAITVSASAEGVIGTAVSAVRASSIFNAARLAGYQAIRDDIRFDQVSIRFEPLYKGTVSGRLVLYLERDTAEGPSASVVLAMDQLENKIGTLSEKLSVTWRPQQPSDRSFIPLSSPATSLALIMMVGDGLGQGGTAIANGATIGTLFLETHATLRGRPN